MPFPEPLKLTVKKRAHFSCVLCHTLGVEIHHLIPQADGGFDIEDNAVPLCPSCHETYGANPQKRKFIREARDFWYELCDRRYASDTDQIEKILQIVQETSSKKDVGQVLDKIADFQKAIDSFLSGVVERDRYITQIDQMQQKLLSIENEMQTKALTLEQLRKREAITHWGVQFATEFLQLQTAQIDHDVTTNYGRVAGTLKKLGHLSSDKFLKIFQAAFSKGPAPEDPASQALYYVSMLYRDFVTLRASIEASLSVVPTLVVEHDKNPQQSVHRLRAILLARFREKAKALTQDNASDKEQ